jgi:hypothetical protein
LSFYPSPALFRLDGRNQRIRPDLVTVQLCLFEGFDYTERDTVPVRFQHDSLAFGKFEPENVHKRYDDMVHCIPVIVVDMGENI